MDNAYTSIIPELIEKIDLEGTSKYFNVSKRDIHNKFSGSNIWFRGIKTQSGNQTAKLKGYKGLSTFVVDEAEEWVSVDDYKKISRSIRSTEADNLVMIVMNPSYYIHWVWEEFFEKSHRIEFIDGFPIEKCTREDVLHIHTTYLDNLSYLPKDFLLDAKKTKETNPEEYRHQFLGGWKKSSEGLIYNNWIEGEFDDSLPFCYGMDFGFSDHPTALVKVAVDEMSKKIYVKTCVYSPGLSVDETLESVKTAILKHGKGSIGGDSSAQQLISHLYENGVDIYPVSKGPGSVLAGINKIQSYTIVVDAEDFCLKGELNRYAWKSKLSEVPNKIHDDAMDAMRYAFIELNRGTMVF